MLDPSATLYHGFENPCFNLVKRKLNPVKSNIELLEKIKNKNIMFGCTGTIGEKFPEEKIKTKILLSQPRIKGSLRRRMYQYSNPGKSQATNLRINELITNELLEGKDVYTFIRVQEDKDQVYFNNMVLVPSLEVIESLLINNFDVVVKLWNIIN